MDIYERAKKFFEDHDDPRVIITDDLNAYHEKHLQFAQRRAREIRGQYHVLTREDVKGKETEGLNKTEVKELAKKAEEEGTIYKNEEGEFEISGEYTGTTKKKDLVEYLFENPEIVEKLK